MQVGLLRLGGDLRSSGLRQVKDIETEAHWDDYRVYAGNWVGARLPEPKEEVIGGKKILYRNFWVHTPAYSMFVDLYWPAGNPSAQTEAEEIGAYVFYTIREEFASGR